MKRGRKTKGAYLKYLKYSQRFIQPCKCNRQVHAYCLTARIIRDQKIYCPRCSSKYNLWIKEEAICSSKLLGVIMKYLVLLVIFLFAGTCFLITDAYFKCKQAKKNKE